MDTSAKKQASYLNKYARVPPSSQDWDRIENTLQLSLGSSTAVIRNVWSITNPNMTLSFQRKNKDLNILDSWLDTSLLDENNRSEKVCQRGFDFPAGGLLFPTGHLNVNQENYSGKNKIYEFFLVRVAVGKPYCISVKSGNMIKEKKKLPYGFDSVYLIHDEDEEEDAKAFKHDYVIFDNTQVLPLYIVHFEFDTSKEEAISTPICDLCQENQANIYCKAEEANFCYFCDEEHHAKLGKLINKHVRVPVSERPKSFGKCSQHPENTLEFYCAQDNEPLCVYCKISGSHSNGEKATHPLVKISEAYAKAITESKEIDPMLERKKNSLTDMLSTIDIKIKEINQNAAEVEEHIYNILQEALKMLQQETQRKLSFLIADQIEIKRQYEQIQWQQSFLRYQQDILNPAEYLHAYSRHLASRAELINAVFIPTITNIQPDMRVEGKVTVISEAKTRVHDKEDDPDKITNEELAQYGTGSKFRSNIFGGKSGETLKNAMFNSLRNVIPMQPQKIPYDSNILSGKQCENSFQITIRNYQPDSKTKPIPEESPADQILQQISLFKPKGNTKLQSFQTFNPAFSLRGAAEDKLTQLKKQNIDSTIQSGQFFKNLFPNSLILEGEEKKILYLNLPFDLHNPPVVNLIWHRPDSSTDGPDVLDLFIKKENQFPSLILFMHGDQKFGGYASHPWVYKKAAKFGDESCFLFNITKDAKLLPIKEGDITYLWQGQSSFSFGTYDLQVEENFNEISSEVEVNYVTGRSLSTVEAKTFLTGMASKFKPEIVEIYTILPNTYF